MITNVPSSITLTYSPRIVSSVSFHFKENLFNTKSLNIKTVLLLFFIIHSTKRILLGHFWFLIVSRK